VAPARAFVISEESAADWRPRLQHLGIRDHVDLLCRPFPLQPNREQWLALVDTAAAMHDRQGTALVVIDSLAQFLPPHSENSAGALLECLTPLQRLTTAGMGVFLVHHPGKGKTVAGQAARGSGALPSFVDVIIEMEYYSQPDDLDRRRRLLAFSRHDETPRHLLLELQADGRDYLVLQSGAEAALGERPVGACYGVVRGRGPGLGGRGCRRQLRGQLVEAGAVAEEFPQGRFQVGIALQVRLQIGRLALLFGLQDLGQHPLEQFVLGRGFRGFVGHSSLHLG
jgi:hypothetical protein